DPTKPCQPEGFQEWRPLRDRLDSGEGRATEVLLAQWRKGKGSEFFKLVVRKRTVEALAECRRRGCAQSRNVDFLAPATVPGYLSRSAEHPCSRLGSSELSQIVRSSENLAISSPQPNIFARNIRIQ